MLNSKSFKQAFIFMIFMCLINCHKGNKPKATCSTGTNLNPAPIVLREPIAIPSLFELVRTNDYHFLTISLAKKINSNELNTRDPQSGNTPLLQAVKNQNLEIVKLLLDAGVDTNITDNEGKTALERAAQNQTIFDLILEYKQKRRQAST